jgi:uncharacterized heparinase superfamily protein
MADITRVLRTAAYLRPGQVTNRIARRLPRRIDLSEPDLPTRDAQGRWAPCDGREPSMLAPNRIALLSEEADIEPSTIWNDCRFSKLWLYHLHYFDDLLAEGPEDRVSWHERLMERWVVENPAARGVGWEPYPISRRVVNWIAWALGGKTLSTRLRRNLVVQTRVLAATLEYHLLGNHLLSDAKALVFAGCFFAGPEADRWLQIGLKILDAELKEQILADGGFFELSPMYHAIVLEDLVDLVQLSQLYAGRLPLLKVRRAHWIALINRMVSWLAAMRHPDGEIAFFNDATFGQARHPNDLEVYAHRFGGCGRPDLPRLVHLRESGYIRLMSDPWYVLFDAAQIGPSYIPGHGHADTLSLEISLGQERVVTNSGTSTYARGRVREYERSTAAHATVEIDGENSSEVWASFRVGRRARPIDVASGISGDELWCRAAHDGYRFLPGRPTHRRQIEVSGHRVLIRDEIVSRRDCEAVGRLPLHPSITLAHSGTDGWLLRTAAGRNIRVTVRGSDEMNSETGSFALRFGRQVPRPVLTWKIRGRSGANIETEIAIR